MPLSTSKARTNIIRAALWCAAAAFFVQASESDAASAMESSIERQFHSSVVHQWAGQISPQGRSHIWLGEERVEIELHEAQVRSGSFRVLRQSNDGAYYEVDTPQSAAVSGHIVGEPGSYVAGSVTGESVNLVVSRPGQSAWSIETLSRGFLLTEPIHASVRDSDVLPTDHRCGHMHANAAPTSIDTLPPMAEQLFGASPVAATAATPTAISSSDLLQLELSIDVDNSQYSRYLSNDVVAISQVESIVAALDAAFRRDLNTTIVLKTLVLRRDVEQDPYAGTTGSLNLLNALRNEWETNLRDERGDLVHLFSNVDFGGSVIGQAYFGSLCTSNRYGVNKVGAMPTMDRRIGLVMHEIGHNVNAWHCNDDSDPRANNFDQSDCRVMCTNPNSCQSTTPPSFGPSSVAVIRSYLESNVFQGCLEVVEPCGADLDGDGVSSIDDIELFVQAFDTGDTEIADTNSDGVLDYFDFAMFLQNAEACQIN